MYKLDIIKDKGSAFNCIKVRLNDVTVCQNFTTNIENLVNIVVLCSSALRFNTEFIVVKIYK